MALYEQLLEKTNGKEYTDYFAIFCPFDEHKSPALLVYPDGFVCLSCHKSGSLDYLAKVLQVKSPKLTQSQSTNILPKWRTWDKKYGGLDGIARYAHETLKRYPKSWFERRKINEFIDQGYFGYLDGWATFVVFDNSGNIVDVVVRSISGKGNTRYVVSSIVDDSSRNLYVPNWKRVQEAKVVYVVMGIIDAWALESLGLPCVTGITGKALPVDRLRELHKKLIIIPDLGEEEDAHRIANEFGMGARVKELHYQDDVKDPDEVRIKYGKEQLLQMIGA